MTAGWLVAASLGAAIAPAISVSADQLRWEFALDETQVKNGPELDGSTNSPGTGSAVIEIDTAAKRLEYRITWDGLVGELSKLHIHGPATSLQSTPRHVIELLGPPEPPAALKKRSGATSGTLELTAFEQPGYGRIELDAILLALESGRAYLNLHTTVFGMGEIRGNLGSPVVER
jgi:hypothetical protein